MSADPRDDLDFIVSESAAAAGAARRIVQRSVLFRSSDERLITKFKKAAADSRNHLANRPDEPETSKELADLELADAHIAEARLRLFRQRELIDRLREKAISTELPERILETMQDTLRLMEEHRTLIRKKLGF